jgi:hypothetical protein
MFIRTIYKSLVGLRKDKGDIVLLDIRNGLVVDDGLE